MHLTMARLLQDLFNKMACRIAPAFMLSLLALAAARADAPFAFADTPGKLPKSAVPVHYAVELKPNLEKLSAAGNVIIDIDVRTPTERLVLNALDMTFASASVDGLGAAN